MAAVLIYKIVIDPGQIIGVGFLVFVPYNDSLDTGSYQFELYTRQNTIKVSTGLLTLTGDSRDSGINERHCITTAWANLREALLFGYDIETIFLRHDIAKK